MAPVDVVVEVLEPPALLWPVSLEVEDEEDVEDAVVAAVAVVDVVLSVLVVVVVVPVVLDEVEVLDVVDVEEAVVVVVPPLLPFRPDNFRFSHTSFSPKRPIFSFAPRPGGGPGSLHLGRA